VDTLLPINRDLGMFPTKFPVTGDAGILLKQHRFVDGGRHNLDRRRKGGCRFRRGLGHPCFRELVAVLAALIAASFMVLRKRRNLPYVVASQAILPALKGVRYRWYVGHVSGLVAQGTTLVLPPLVVLRKGSNPTCIMAGQTILTALYRVRHRDDLANLSGLVAICTAIVLPALVILGKGSYLARVVASEAVFLALNGMWHWRHRF
jgi:hypothetical protein